MTLPDRRFGWASPTTAAWAGGISAGLVVLTLVLSLLHYRLTGSSDGASFVISLVFTAVGVLVARRQPRNVVGWLLIGFGLTSQISNFALLLITFDVRIWHGAALIARLALFGEGTLWDLGILLFLPAVLLFPDGITHSARWRIILWSYWVLCTLILISQGLATAFVLSAKEISVSASGNVTVIPMPKQVFAGLVGSGLIVLTLVPFLAMAIVHQVGRFRRATGDVRQQIKWFTAGTAVALLGLVVSTIAGAQPRATLLTSVAASVATYATIAFPLGIGFGMLKYRLYDVDRLISRTLSYAIVTGLLVGVYVGLVTLATRVLPFSSPLGVAASTLAAVALFNPLRRRVQRVVDRRFNRARYDSEATVSAFAARLREAVDLETVRRDLLAVVGDSFEPVHMALWMLGGPVADAPE
ncbi:MAG: hypothetical protein WBA31_08040 [Candidatus Dormiibacterota bacterium]